MGVLRLLRRTSLQAARRKPRGEKLRRRKGLAEPERRQRRSAAAREKKPEQRLQLLQKQLKKELRKRMTVMPQTPLSTSTLARQ